MSDVVLTVNDTNFEELILHASVPALIDLWAPWCAPCRTETPELETVYTEYRDRGVQFLGIDQGSFWSQMRGAVELSDVNEGLIKGVTFGIACSLIAVFEGYNAAPTAEGVGRAATSAFVYSFVLILVLDLHLGILIDAVYYTFWPEGARFL